MRDAEHWRIRWLSSRTPRSRAKRAYDGCLTGLLHPGPPAEGHEHLSYASALPANVPYFFDYASITLGLLKLGT
jgi:hypothetical protein